MSAIESALDVRAELAALAPLFCYPERLPLQPAVDGFAREIAALDLGALQSLYTSTFDLAPICSPYLGIHLFGEEGRERARLMVGLRLAYGRGGESRSSELPDHVAEVLRFAPRFAEDEWEELRTLVLTPALTKMHELLSASSNPYRHAVAAVLAMARGGRA